MNTPKKQARAAVILYFVACATAPFALLYVPQALIVPGDATATANHLRASETLLRLGIAGELWNSVFVIFAVLAFYRLLKGVNEKLALAMLTLMLLSIPISLLNVLNEVAALKLVGGAGWLSVFEQRQLDALVLLFLNLHSQGLNIAAIFWGLWLFPFGILIMRSGFIPRAVGIFVILAGIPYVVDSITTLVLPHYAYLSRYLMPLEAGELALLWILIWGAKEPTIAA